MKQINNKISLLMVVGVVLSPVLEQALAQSPSPQGSYSPSNAPSSGVFSEMSSIVCGLGITGVIGCCGIFLKLCQACHTPSCCDSSDYDSDRR